MEELFGQEYGKIEKSLFLVAFSYLHNTEDARDAVQEAALAAYRKIDTLKNRKYFKTWMTRIVINKCKDFLKSRRYTEELNDDLNIFCDLADEDMEIVDLICHLEKKYALYITLRFYNDMTYEEVARLLRQPVSTVKQRTVKALEKLKVLLEGEAKDEK